MAKCVSPWYNHTGGLGIKHQFTYLQLKDIFTVVKKFFLNGYVLVLFLLFLCSKLVCQGSPLLHEYLKMHESTKFGVIEIMHT